MLFSNTKLLLFSSKKNEDEQLRIDELYAMGLGSGMDHEKALKNAQEQILTEINKIQTKIDSNTEEQDKKRIVIETRQKEILDKIDGEINREN